MGLDEMEGAGNFVMVADPATFRVLPWANDTGWMLCDIYFPNGKPVPFSHAGAYRDALAQACASSGFDFFAGLEVEFQLFKLVDPKLAPDGADLAARGAGGRAHHARLSVSHRGALRSGRSDPGNPAQDRAGAGPAAALARSGAWPEPIRVHLRAADGPRGGRHHGAVPQRHEAGGAAARPSRQLHVPAAPAQHLRQRLASASVAARPQNRARTCSSRTTRRNCCRRSAGTISPACSRMRARRRRSRTPTINGYKRYHGVNSMAPIQAIWAKDNRGVMIRVLGEPGDAVDASGKPRRRAARQSVSLHGVADPRGLDGIARKLEPGPSADAPYEIQGRAVAEVARRGAGGAQGQRLLPRGLRRRLRRLSLRIKTRRDRALRRAKPAVSPATRPRSPPGSTTSISISPEAPASVARRKFSRLHGPSRNGALRCLKKAAKLCHFEPFLWQKTAEKKLVNSVDIYG